jgi:hypothetical protein
VSAPRIRVEIGELVLHGFDPRDRRAIGDAVAAELTRALEAQPFASRPRSADRLDAGSIGAVPRPPQAIGAAIARTVHERLRSS